MNKIEEPIGKFIIENAEGVQTGNGVYYHYSDVCRLLKAQKKQLTIPAVVEQSEQFKCGKCKSTWGEIRSTCFNCGHESEDLST